MTHYSYIPIILIAMVVGMLFSGGWHFRDQYMTPDPAIATMSAALGGQQATLVPSATIAPSPTP